jgi:transposase
VDENVRNEIIYRHHTGESMRAIARALHVSRNTVTDVLQGFDQQRRGVNRNPPRPPRADKLAPFEATIQNVLSHQPNIKIVQLLDDLRAQGYAGSYTILRQRVKAARQEAQGHATPALSGVSAQVRFHELTFDQIGTGHRQAHLFTFFLVRAQYIYCRFVWARDFVTTLHEHLRVFEWLGGVPLVIEYRDVESVVMANGGESVVKPTFLRFATHYGFRPILSESGDESGAAELVQRLDRDLLRPQRFRSLDHLNDVATAWLVQTAGPDRAIVDRTSAKPSVASDLDYLAPLPECAWQG